MIYVKCNDGSLKLGGDFNSALAYVKSFPGRKYDWAEKIWRIPADVRTVAMGVPVGGAFYIDEILINPKPQDITELRARLQARLRDLAPEAVAKKIEHLIVEGLFWDAIENGFLQLSPGRFSSGALVR